jgi:hypothetical protein
VPPDRASRRPRLTVTFRNAWLAAIAVATGCARRGDYVVHRAAGRIVIDGVLAEASWDRAEPAGPFVRSLDGKPCGVQTIARLLWDDDSLYVAFHVEDPDISTPFSGDDEPLYTSNVVEIFLNPSGDLSRYDEIELAPSNALFDASFTGRRQGMDLTWSSRARHAVHLDGTLNDPRDVDRGWTAELAIPFAALTGMPARRPRRGDRWRFNLYRLRQSPGQTAEGQAYSPPMVGDFHAVDRFATMRFED